MRDPIAKVFDDITVSDEDGYLLQYMFPEWKVQREISAFSSSLKIFWLGGRHKSHGTANEVIGVRRNGPRQLSDKRVLIEVFEAHGVHLSEGFKQMASLLDQDEFTHQMKILWVAGRLDRVLNTTEGSVFHLFAGLFESFKETYVKYKTIDMPHRVTLSALVTMMLKSRMEDLVVSPGYKKVLVKNAMYFPVFQRAILSYIESEQREFDFMGLLYDCSLEGRQT